MELKIIDKKDKPLLLRTEIITEISFEGKTPSKEDVKKSIVNELKADENLVIIKKIRTYFGIKKATVTAYVYSSKKDMEKIEPKEKKKNKKPAKKEKPKEEKKEEAKEGKKETKEEKKEEVKEEELKKKEAKEKKKEEPKEEKK